MADLFETHAAGLETPAQRAFSITPDDNNDLAYITRAIYTGAGGSLACLLMDDSTSVVLSNLPSGQVMPLRVRRVLSTGTTASMGLVGLV